MYIYTYMCIYKYIYIYLYIYIYIYRERETDRDIDIHKYAPKTATTLNIFSNSPLERMALEQTLLPIESCCIRAPALRLGLLPPVDHATY